MKSAWRLLVITSLLTWHITSALHEGILRASSLRRLNAQSQGSAAVMYPKSVKADRMEVIQQKLAQISQQKGIFKGCFAPWDRLRGRRRNDSRALDDLFRFRRNPIPNTDMYKAKWKAMKENISSKLDTWRGKVSATSTFGSNTHGNGVDIYSGRLQHFFKGSLASSLYQAPGTPSVTS